MHSQFHLRPASTGYCRAFARLVSPEGGAFANPGAIPELLTRTRFPIRMTTQKVLLERKQIGSSVKGKNKLKRVVKACSQFYGCISLLLIKPELHSENRAIDVDHRFLVIELNFSCL